MPEPALSPEIEASDLDVEVRRDLRGLQKETAESVARHLVAAGQLLDEDPAAALEHARFARRRAARIAVVREAAGIVAYHAGEWAEALNDLRAARRMGGGPGHLAVMADIERALGRPERALELARGPEVKELGTAERIELTIVAAGARRDLGEVGASVVGLQIPELDPARREPWSARLFYAYADNLLAEGRESDALQWFVHALDADPAGETDAARRVAELTGEPFEEGHDDDIVFGMEEVGSDEGAVAAEDGGDPAPEGSDAETAEVPDAVAPVAELAGGTAVSAVAQAGPEAVGVADIADDTVPDADATVRVDDAADDEGPAGAMPQDRARCAGAPEDGAPITVDTAPESAADGADPAPPTAAEPEPVSGRDGPCAS